MPELHLTNCELEVMDVVWRKQRVTVQEVCDSLSRELAYTTVMTTLRILEEKRGVLRREKSGRAFVYEPTVSREAVRQHMAGDLARRLFSGSAKSLMLSLLGARQVSPQDIRELKQVIETLDREEAA
jgi:predicted transcriptional regulator